MNVSDLVVGDVILLKAGNIMPADCVIIECNDLIVNETRIAEVEFEDDTEMIQGRMQVKKTVNDDPFLYSSS